MPFNSIVGQKSAVDFLQRSLEHDRLAHALLFTGPEGIGKRASALALAQALNCEAGRKNEACGECSSCRKIQSGVHLDVQTIVAEGQGIKIEQVRETLQRGAIYQPLEGKTKVFILDPAETMSAEAANSLLKLLEEPPANLVVILITSQPFALLETIRSRCQEIRFHALDRQVLAAWLRTQLEVSAEEAGALAMLSGGRPAEALRLADPEQKKLRSQVLEMAGALPTQDWAEFAKQLGDYSAELPEILLFLLTWFRDLLVLASGGGQELLINRDYAARLQAMAAKHAVDKLQADYRSVLRAMEQRRQNANTQLLLETMFLGLGRA